MPCAGEKVSFTAYSGLVPMSPKTTPSASSVSAPLDECGMRGSWELTCRKLFHEAGQIKRDDREGHEDRQPYAVHRHERHDAAEHDAGRHLRQQRGEHEQVHADRRADKADF